MTEPWTIARLAAWITRDLAAREVTSARLEAELIVAHALKLRRLDVFLRLDQPLSSDELAAVRALVERRRRHEPLAYLTGERDFYGRTFAVDRRVLIPRPETEHVVDAAVTHLRDLGRASASLLDLCTGSGCVAVAVALAVPELTVDAVDLSPAALEVARANVARHGVAERVRLHEGSLYKPLGDRRFDVIVSNPPYIPSDEVPRLMPDVALHEPSLALDGGPDGTVVLGALLGAATRHMNPGALLAVEVGHDQGAWALRAAELHGLRDARMARDLAGVERVLLARAG